MRSLCRTLSAFSLRGSVPLLAALVVGFSFFTAPAAAQQRTVTLSVSPSVLSEGADATDVKVTGTLSGALPTAEIMIELSMAGLSDRVAFTPTSTSETLTFAVGSRTAEATIENVTPDDEERVTENQVITFTGTTETADVTVVPATLTLVNDDVYPVLQSAEVNGPKLTLTYSKVMHASNLPVNAQYAVRVGASANPLVTAVARRIADTKKIDLTLGVPVKAGETVSVSYDRDNKFDGTAGAQRLTDAGHDDNAAASFSAVAVTNVTKIPGVTITNNDPDREGNPVNELGYTAKFTFTEPVEGFDSDDITVGNGLVVGGVTASDDRKVFTAKIDPEPENTHGRSLSVDVAAGAATSYYVNTPTGSGTPNSAATRYSLTIDTKDPTVTISGPSSVTKAFNVSIRFSEPVEGFMADEVVVSGGNTTNFRTVSTSSYAVTVTPNTGQDVSVTVDVAAGVATDVAMNPNVVAPQYTATANKAELSVNVTGPSSWTRGEFVARFTFSSTVASFDASVNGGVVVGDAEMLAENPAVYVATIKPSSTTVGEAASVEVNIGSVTDAANDAYPPDPTPLTVTARVGPTPSITRSNSGTVTENDPAELAITFDNTPVRGFTASDLRVTNGRASNLRQGADASSWTVDITPLRDEAIKITLPTNAVQTVTGGYGNYASEELEIGESNVDVSPTVAITGPAGPVSGSFAVTITFDNKDDISGFAADDIVVSSNLSIASLTPSGASKIFTATITPKSSGTATVYVPAAVVQDAASNDNKRSNTYSVRVDLTQATGVRLSLNPTTVSESAGTTTVTVTASVVGVAYTAASTVTVNVAGTSGAGAVDFEPVSSFTISIPANTQSATGTFTLTPVNDSVVETQQRITVSGTLDNGDPVASADLTLTDDDGGGVGSGVALSVDPSSIDEDAGTTVVTVTATVTAGTYSNAREIRIAVVGSGNENVVGFETVPTFEINLPANARSASAIFRITPTDDTIDEQDEVITVSGRFSGPSSERDPVTSATLTLVDDDDPPEGVTLTADPTTVSEGAGPTEITLTAAAVNGTSFGTDQTIAVTVAGSGVAGVVGFRSVPDFEIVLEAGESSVEHKFELAPVDNMLDEADETITVTATHGEKTSTTTITLTDDDETPTGITLTAMPTTVSEGAGTRTVIVEAKVGGTTAYATDQVLNMSVAGSGVPGVVGFDPVPNFNLTIAAGEMSASRSFQLTPRNNTVDEEDETITVSSPHGDGTVSTTVILTDNDASPTGIALAISPGALTEGAGTQTVTLTATVTGGTTYGSAQEVAITVAGSGAAGVVGFAPVDPLTLTIPLGERQGTATFVLTPEDNLIDEQDETITVTGEHDGSTVAVTLDIADDDAAPTGIALSLNPTSLDEDAGTTKITVTADVEGGTRYAAEQTVAVTVAGSGNDGVVGFPAVPAFNVTIPAGEAAGTRTFTITPVDNVIDEADETVTVTGTHNNVAETVTLTLKDNDAAPTGISIATDPISVAENAGETSVTLTASVEGGTTYASAQTVAVTVAGSGNDGVVGFTPVPAFNVTIEPGEASGTHMFTITPEDNVIDEADETVTVTGTHNNNVDTVTLTLEDDDAAPEGISIATNPTSVAENAGATSVTLTASVDGGTTYAFAQTVAVSVAGSGTAGVVGFAPVADFEVTVPAGAAMETATFIITPEDNVIDEADESVILTATHAGMSTTATLALIDDDATPTGIAISLDPTSVSEAAGSATITVTATVEGGTTYAADQTLDVSVSGSGGAGVVQFAPVQAFDIVLAAGTATAMGTFTLTPQNNQERESDETVTVTAGTSQATLTLVDDDAAVARFAEVTGVILPELTRAMTASSLGAISDRITNSQQSAASSDMALSVGGYTTLSGFVRGYQNSRMYGSTPMQERLRGTSFAFSPNSGIAALGGRITMWGQGDYRGLSGGDDGVVGWDGSLSGLHVGVDASVGGGLLVGVAGSRTAGSVDYTYSGANLDTGSSVSGTYKSTMHSLHPYLSYSWSPGSALWGSAGFGDGEVTINDDQATEDATDSRMNVLAAGAAFRLMSGGSTSLRLKGEAWQSSVELDGNGGLIKETTVDVSRLRLALEGAFNRSLAGGGVISPFVELGLRTDGGDGETGMGVELGGGVRYVQASAGLTIEGRGRTLLAHAGDVKEWGVSGMIGYRPGAGGRGMSVELGTSAGVAASGLSQLWSDRMVHRALGNNSMSPRLTSKVGYGIDIGTGMLVPYSAVDMSSIVGRSTRVGTEYRITPRFNVGIEVEHSARPGFAGRAPMVRGRVVLR